MHSDNEIWSVKRVQREKHFFEKSYTKFGGDTIPNQN